MPHAYGGASIQLTGFTNQGSVSRLMGHGDEHEMEPWQRMAPDERRGHVGRPHRGADTGVGGRADRCKGDVHQGRRTDPAAFLSELPSVWAGRRRPDVATHL